MSSARGEPAYWAGVMGRLLNHPQYHMPRQCPTHPTTHHCLPLPHPTPAAELLTTPEIMCRAWDSSMNTQPNTFTW